MTDLPIVVLISGNGTNLQAMMDARDQGLAINIRAVISNQKNAFGLERAKRANIPTQVISHQDYPTRDTFDAALIEQIDLYQPHLLVLAGFMRRLGTTMVSHYKNKILNIHPSLLPKYPGLQTHRQVLDNKDLWHGTSIHIVTDDLDAGPLICQAAFKVAKNDTESSLKTRIQKIEHHLYPSVLKLFAEGRITVNNKTILLDGEILPTSGITPSNQTKIFIEITDKNM